MRIYLLNSNLDYDLFFHCIWPDGTIRNGSKLLLAVSGGPDSICLLHVLREVLLQHQALDKVDVEVAHFNHRLRGSASDQDEHFVQAICNELGYTLHIARADAVPEQATGSSETWARTVRHAFLEERRQALSKDAYLLLGHNQDDLLETFLINMGRGSGLKGLSAMPARDEDAKILRPLLHTSRKEIMNYLNVNDHAYREDLSNLDKSSWRNRLRLEVTPVLKEMFDPKLGQRMNQLSELLRDDEAYLQEQVAKIRADLVEEIQGDNKELLYQTFSRQNFLNLHLAMQKRLLRSIFYRWVEDQMNLHYQTIEDCLNCIQDEASVAVDLPFSIRVERKDDQIRFYKKDFLSSYVGSLTVPVMDTRRSKTKKVKVFLLDEAIGVDLLLDQYNSSFSRNPYQATREEEANRFLLDPKDMLEYEVRNRQIDDYLALQGSQGPFRKRLKQYLQELALWPELRDRLMLVAKGSKVHWIPGIIHVNYLKEDEKSVKMQEQLTEICFM